MRTLMIPTIGTVLTLARDWTFTYIAEYRNTGLFDYMKTAGIVAPDATQYRPLPECCGVTLFQPVRPGFNAMYPDRPCRLPAGHDGEHNAFSPRPSREPVRYQCTLPAGTALRVDRIYIRKGKADYDSMTFWATGLQAKGKSKKDARVRFFARLGDINCMQVLDEGEQPVASEQLPIRAVYLRE